MVMLCRKYADVIISIFIFIIGFAVCRYYGVFHFDPGDSSVLNGGWRVANGSYPLIDYILYFGLIPDLIQGIYVKIFSNLYISVIINSSVMSGLYCVIIYNTIYKLGNDRTIAFVTAVVSSLLLFTARGNPIAENFSAFFCFVSFVLIVLRWHFNINSNSGTFIIYQFIMLFFWLGYFSKQSPAIFFISFIFMDIIINSNRLYAIMSTVISSVAVAAIILLTSYFSRFDYIYILQSLFVIPFNIGSSRIDTDYLRIVTRIFTATEYSIGGVNGMILMIYSMYIANIYIWLKHSNKNINLMVIPTLLFGLQLANNLFLNLTTSGGETNVYFSFFVLSGLSITAERMFLFRTDLVNPLQQEFPSALIKIIIIPFLLLSANAYAKDIVALKSVFKHDFNKSALRANIKVDIPALQGMYWTNKICTKEEAEEIYKYLNSLDANFVGGTCFGGMFVGNTRVILNKKEIIPVSTANAYPSRMVDDFKNMLFQEITKALTDNNVMYIVNFNEDKSFEHPAVEAYMKERGVCKEEAVNKHRVYFLCK